MTIDEEREQGEGQESETIPSPEPTSPDALTAEGKEIGFEQLLLRLEEQKALLQSLKDALQEKNPEAARAIARRLKASRADEKKEGGLMSFFRSFTPTDVLRMSADPSILKTKILETPEVRKVLGEILSLVKGGESQEGIASLLKNEDIRNIFSSGGSTGVSEVAAESGAVAAEGAEAAEIAESIEGLELIADLL